MLDSPMFWTPDEKACPPTPNRFFQFHLEKRWGMEKCKLGVISQKRLQIEVKLLLSANGQSRSHICRVDWHNNG